MTIDKKYKTYDSAVNQLVEHFDIIDSEGLDREGLAQSWSIVFREAESEKARRIYYQGIVYSLCAQLDRYFGNKPGSGIVCGNSREPSSALQRALKIALNRAKLNDRQLADPEALKAERNQND